MYDQIIVRFRSKNSKTENAGGLLQLANPASGYIILQSLHKRNSEGTPIEYRVSTLEGTRFFVQEHHLRKLRIRSEYDSIREAQRIIRPEAPTISDIDLASSEEEVLMQQTIPKPKKITATLPRQSIYDSSVMPPKFAMKNTAHLVDSSQ